MDKLKLAHEFVKSYHHDHKRKFTGDPYISHLEETAQLLWEATNGQADKDDYIAALCHDVVEYASEAKAELGRLFGMGPMSIVSELTNEEEQLKLLGKAVYLSQKINAMSDRAFTIKLCDRLSNVMGLNDHRIPNVFVVKYIDETDYIIRKLNRVITEPQQYLINRITSMLMFLKIDRSL